MYKVQINLQNSEETMNKTKKIHNMVQLIRKPNK